MDQLPHQASSLRVQNFLIQQQIRLALMLKNNTAFGQCWRSKFERSNKCSQVDGSVDPEVITNKFADHFRAFIICNNPDKAELLKQSYLDLRATYCGLPATDTHKIDTELVSRTITNLKRRKAIDIDVLTAEHLQFCHPVLPVILKKIFTLEHSLSVLYCLKFLNTA